MIQKCLVDTTPTLALPKPGLLNPDGGCRPRRTVRVDIPSVPRSAICLERAQPTPRRRPLPLPGSAQRVVDALLAQHSQALQVRRTVGATASATDVQHHRRRCLDQNDLENHWRADAIDTGRHELTLKRGMRSGWCCTFVARGPIWSRSATDYELLRTLRALEIKRFQRFASTS